MKKVLILVGRHNWKHEFLTEEIKKECGNDAEIYLKDVKDLVFTIKDKKVEAFIDDLSIKDFDLVFFRRLGIFNLHLVGCLIQILDNLDIKFVDQYLRKTSVRGDKLTNQVSLSYNNVPTIDTFYCSLEKIQDNKNKIIDLIKFPIIVKELYRHYATGIYILRNKEDFKMLTIDLGRRFLFQPFLEIESEYRVLVLGGKAVSAQKMSRDLTGDIAIVNDKETKDNFNFLNKIGEEAIKISEAAAKTLDIQVAGVDVAKDKEGKWWVIEVNRGPALTYDTKISPEVTEIAKYIASKVK